MFLMSKCSGESDLGLCMTSVLAKRMPLRSSDFRRILRPNTFKNRNLALHSGILFACTEVMHRPRSDSPLHFDTRNTSQIRMGKKNASARRLPLFVCLFVCWNKTRKTLPPVGKEVNPLGVVKHGQRHKPRHAYQRQRYDSPSPRTCQSMVNTL